MASIFGDDSLRRRALSGIQIIESDLAPHPEIQRVEWITRKRGPYGPGIYQFDHALRRQGSTYRNVGEYKAIIMAGKVIVHPAMASQLRQSIQGQHGGLIP